MENSRMDAKKNGEVWNAAWGIDSKHIENIDGYEAALDTYIQHATDVKVTLWHAKLLIGGLIVIIVTLAVLAVIMGIKAQAVVPFVQVVQVDEQGRVQMLGVPKEMMDYTPQDAQWIQMLWEFITRLRWQETDQRHEDEVWKKGGWLDLHTCGVARQQISEMRDEDLALKSKGEKVKVEVAPKNVTKLELPMAWNVTWEEERFVGSAKGKKSEKIWTFKVTRRKVDSVAMRGMNPYGLCVSGISRGPLQ